jgi:hypothetical protein
MPLSGIEFIVLLLLPEQIGPVDYSATALKQLSIGTRPAQGFPYGSVYERVNRPSCGEQKTTPGIDNNARYSILGAVSAMSFMYVLTSPLH